jgi:OOP family OmpA-OmpF porin
MKTTFTKKHALISTACALALSAGMGAARAQNALAPADERALVTNASSTAWTNAAGECWQSGFGPGPVANTACGPQPAKTVPVAAAAPAAEPVAAATVPTAYEKVAFDADVLFDSNASALRPEGREMLDTFAEQILGLESQPVRIIGYADRMGSQAANQALSEDRVSAVKDYLVGKGIAAERVQTGARGEGEPTTMASDCSEANTPKNLACLQPDRHVVIQVSGSRVAK